MARTQRITLNDNADIRVVDNNFIALDDGLDTLKDYVDTQDANTKTYAEDYSKNLTGIDGYVTTLPTPSATYLNKKYRRTTDNVIYKCMQTASNTYAWVKGITIITRETISISNTKNTTDYYNASSPTYGTWFRLNSTRAYIWVCRVKLTKLHSISNTSNIDFTTFPSNRSIIAQATIAIDMYMSACIYFVDYIASDNSVLIYAFDPNTTDGWFDQSRNGNNLCINIPE